MYLVEQNWRHDIHSALVFLMQVSFLLSWDSVTGEFGKWLGEVLFRLRNSVFSLGWNFFLRQLGVIFGDYG